MSTIFKLPLFVVCYSQQSLTFKREAVMKDRLKEPSSYAGLGLVFNGISQCLSGDYQTGALNIILGLVAVFKTEGGKIG